MLLSPPPSPSGGGSSPSTSACPLPAVLKPVPARASSNGRLEIPSSSSSFARRRRSSAGDSVAPDRDASGRRKSSTSLKGGAGGRPGLAGSGGAAGGGGRSSSRPGSPLNAVRSNGARSIPQRSASASAHRPLLYAPPRAERRIVETAPTPLSTASPTSSSARRLPTRRIAQTPPLSPFPQRYQLGSSLAPPPTQQQRSASTSAVPPTSAFRTPPSGAGRRSAPVLQSYPPSPKSSVRPVAVVHHQIDGSNSGATTHSSSSSSLSSSSYSFAAARPHPAKRSHISTLSRRQISHTLPPEESLIPQGALSSRSASASQLKFPASSFSLRRRSSSAAGSPTTSEAETRLRDLLSNDERALYDGGLAAGLTEDELFRELDPARQLAKARETFEDDMARWADGAPEVPRALRMIEEVTTASVLVSRAHSSSLASSPLTSPQGASLKPLPSRQTSLTPSPGDRLSGFSPSSSPLSTCSHLPMAVSPLFETRLALPALTNKKRTHSISSFPSVHSLKACSPIASGATSPKLVPSSPSSPSPYEDASPVAYHYPRQPMASANHARLIRAVTAPVFHHQHPQQAHAQFPHSPPPSTCRSTSNPLLFHSHHYSSSSNSGWSTPAPLPPTTTPATATTTSPTPTVEFDLEQTLARCREIGAGQYVSFQDVGIPLPEGMDEDEAGHDAGQGGERGKRGKGWLVWMGLSSGGNTMAHQEQQRL